MKHYMIAHLLAQGKPQTVVAKKLNISTQVIQNCLKTPAFLIALDELRSEYAEKISDKAVVPFAEMQRRVNEEALDALSRVVDISCGERASTTMLNANLAILDRASNTPKASKGDTGEAPRDLFNVSVVQLVLETALQVGDRTVLKSAQKALAGASSNTVELEPFDVENSPVPLPDETPSLTHSLSSPGSPFAMKSLDDVLDSVSHTEDLYE